MFYLKVLAAFVLTAGLAGGAYAFTFVPPLKVQNAQSTQVAQATQAPQVPQAFQAPIEPMDLESSSPDDLFKAAQNGSTDDRYRAAYAFENGTGVPVDLYRAAQLYLAAAQEGHPDAQFSLGVFLSQGKGGLPVNQSESARWLLKAAEQGVPQAQYNVALAYFKGLGLPKNETQAVFWMKKAASSGLVEAEQFIAENNL
ncbi:MAG: sel1 repeat family protein [Deltaproteobacteria bacterium]|jgi:hypothetical protein|nr:sel1 repeat family protein [Deltaproteobacteria bacterium]